MNEPKIPPPVVAFWVIGLAIAIPLLIAFGVWLARLQGEADRGLGF